MSKINDLMWFKTKVPLKYNDEVIIEAGKKVEMYVGASDKIGRFYEENLFILTGKGETLVFKFFNKEKFVLPEKCLLSNVGDVFCSKKKTVFAITHFGRSGYWGILKRILPNQKHFKFCPQCGKKLSNFPVLVERKIGYSSSEELIRAINEEDI